MTLRTPTGGAVIGTATGTGTIRDDDERGVTVSAATSGLGVTENRTATYTVGLTSQPTGAVTVTVGGTGAGVTVAPSAVTFTASTWGTARTVTVAAAEDGNSQSETVTLTHTVSGADYGANSVPAGSVTVTVTDNDTPGLDVTPTTLGVTEGATGTYTVRLTTEPSGPVTVAVASGTPATATVAPSTLTFTASTWATAQPVTVTGTEDADATTDEQATVTHQPSGASEYTNVAPNARPSVTVTVTDDETRGVTISAATAGLGVQEGSGAAYTVVLTAQPVGGDVTVTVSGTTSTVTVEASDLRFTATTWATAQTVSVSAAEDDNSGHETVTLTHGVAGADYGATSVTAGSVTVTVTDNDSPSVAVAPTDLTVAEGSTGTYTVRLTTEPSGAVTVAVGGTTSAVTADVAAAAGLQTALTFSPTTWRTAQTVTVTAGTDDDAQDETATLTHTPTGASEYAALPPGAARPSTAITVTDDETRGVTVSAAPAGLTVAEGTTATYTVVLTAQPVGGAVHVTVSTSAVTSPVTVDVGAAAGEPHTLTFTATTWATAQPVTVTAGEDDNAGDGAATLTHAVTGADYGAQSVTAAPVTVTVTDDDSPSLAVTPSDLTVAEGSTGTYTVRLLTEPSGPVTVAVASGTTATATVAPSTLTFTASTWATAQPVTVTGTPDADATTHEQATVTHTPSAGPANTRLCRRGRRGRA